MLTAEQVLPGITHITDAMGVSFTLAEGEKQALLFDTGYGMEDVQAFVRTLTDKPVTVYLSHGHHDHMLGARWFERTFLCREDMEEFVERTGEGQRTKVKKQAQEQQVRVPEDFMTAFIQKPEEICFTEPVGTFQRKRENLGGREAQVIRVPGHTPGSIVIYMPELDLLLTGDDWNPCTWMWFPSSLAAGQWRDNMLELIRILEKETGRELKHVLCPHQKKMRNANELKGFLEYMTDERMKKAPSIDMGAPIDTHEIRDDLHDWQLIFDYRKIQAAFRPSC